MKIVIPQRRPRNPLVAPTRFRSAGRHRSRRGVQRHDNECAWRRELEGLAGPSP
jgi:hypothetical protein